MDALPLKGCLMVPHTEGTELMSYHRFKFVAAPQPQERKRKIKLGLEQPGERWDSCSMRQMSLVI